MSVKQPPKKYHWIRLHTEIVDDAKLADFTAEEFRIWIYLLCLTSDGMAQGADRGIIPMTTDLVSWRLRKPLEVVREALIKFEQRGMVTRTTTTITIVKFDARQYDKESDKPEETRVRKQRSRERSRVTSRDGHAESRPGHAREEIREEKKRLEESTETTLSGRGPDVTVRPEWSDEIPTGTATGQRVLIEPTPSPTPPKPKPPKPRQDYPAAFLSWWDAYPRNVVGKHPAYVRWAAIVKAREATEAQLVAAARHYGLEVVRENTAPQYVKHGATFLSARDKHWLGYVDGPPVPQAKPFYDPYERITVKR